MNSKAGTNSKVSNMGGVWALKEGFFKLRKMADSQVYDPEISATKSEQSLSGRAERRRAWEGWSVWVRWGQWVRLVRGPWRGFDDDHVTKCILDKEPVLVLHCSQGVHRVIAYRWTLKVLCIPLPGQVLENSVAVFINGSLGVSATQAFMK